MKKKVHARERSSIKGLIGGHQSRNVVLILSSDTYYEFNKRRERLKVAQWRARDQIKESFMRLHDAAILITGH